MIHQSLYLPYLLMQNLSEPYGNAHNMMLALRAAFGSHEVRFSGEYTIAIDPLVSCRERAEMTAREVWQVSGYRWT